MAKILITSALPYINGIKHLGNLVGSMLPADVFARFKRACGNEVLYICATDEHGTPAEIASIQNGKSPKDYCDQLHKIQKDIYQAYGLSFDYFGRSSAIENHKLTQYFAGKLEDNGFIKEQSDVQIYSNHDKRFLPDRYVGGTCPHCGYEKARGDQCDQCSTLLDPQELIDPYSSLSGSKDVEEKTTTHLFLRQSKLQNKVKEWLSKKKQFPSLTKSIAQKWLKEGLRDRSITRDLQWGIKVKNIAGELRKGFENKVFYVWFDAPITYISATMAWAKENNKDYRQWWKIDHGADDVAYYQFMGKDNVSFHAISFPCTIIGANDKWKTVDCLKSLNWLNWYGGKFSTSQNQGIFMDEAIKLLPADYWRWWLMKNAPESDDTSFTIDNFVDDCNKDLADVFGNFCNRIYKFNLSKFEGCMPTKIIDFSEQGKHDILDGNLVKDKDYLQLKENFEEMVQRLYSLVVEYISYMEQVEFRKATNTLRTIWVLGNEYMQLSAPWAVYKINHKLAASIVNIAFHFMLIISELSKIYIPTSCKKINGFFNLSDKQQFLIKEIWQVNSLGGKETMFKFFDIIQEGQKFSDLEILFNKIMPEEKTAWKEKFAQNC